MTGLSKARIAEKEKLNSNLQEKRAALEEAISDFNSQIEELFNEVLSEPLQELNGAIEAGRNFLLEVQDEHQEIYDGRSEKWQESDKGLAYSGWINDLEDAI